MEKTIIIYGSLRKGFYNHARKMTRGCRFIGSCKLKGWKLYSLGSYPAINPSPTKKDIVVAEVYKVPEEVFTEIDYMEKSAGYKSKKEEVIVNNKVKRGVVWFHPKDFENAPGIKRVVSGDWALFNKNERIER